MKNNRISAKRRLMFIQKEDYNFLAYSTLILLKSLDCTDDKKRFKDFRKIAYLVDFVNEGGTPSLFEQERLAQIYAKAQIKKKLMHHLIIVLKNKNLITVDLNGATQTIDLWLNKDKIPTDFFDNDFFAKEMNNAKVLKQTLTARIRGFTIKTMVEKIFKENNILTWEV